MQNREIIRHGECLLIPITELPNGSVVIKNTKEVIVAHSESGHNHIAVADEITSYSFNAESVKSKLSNTLFGHADISGLIYLGSNGFVTHQKTFDQHETKPLTKGFYVIVQKNAYNYFRKLQERVVD